MAEKKIIAVLGATGAQGGGLVRAILRDPQGGFGGRNRAALEELLRNPAAEAEVGRTMTKAVASDKWRVTSDCK